MPPVNGRYEKFWTWPKDKVLTIEELRRQVSVVGDDFDTDLLAYEKSAVDFIENRIGRSILYSGYYAYFKEFCPQVFLHFGPVYTVDTVHFSDGVNENILLPSKNYRLLKAKKSSEILAFQNCPRIGAHFHSEVKIKYYARTLPQERESIKQAVKMLVGHYFENRETTTDKNLKAVPHGLNALLSNYFP